MTAAVIGTRSTKPPKNSRRSPPPMSNGLPTNISAKITAPLPFIPANRAQPRRRKLKRKGTRRSNENEIECSVFNRYRIAFNSYPNYRFGDRVRGQDLENQDRNRGRRF